MPSSNVKFVSLLAVIFAGLVGAQSVAQSPRTPTVPPSLTAPSVASHAPTGTVPRFRTGVDVVVLDVCVKNRDGQFIPSLSAEDFLILENNIPQTVAFFSGEERVPLAVVLLVDRSQSMHGAKLDRASAAAAAFLRTLRPGDLVEVIAFNDRASLLYPLGPDHVVAEQAIFGLTATGMTGLFEAVAVAQRDLGRAQSSRTAEYRNAIVILSDGEDTSSLVSFDDVLEDVRRSGVLVYAISLRTDEHDRSLAPLRELSQLAFDTGGQAFAVRRLVELIPIYEAIGAEFRHLYRLAYVPSPAAQDGRWHSISVRGANKDLRVRTRSGYYAPRPPLNVVKGSEP